MALPTATMSAKRSSCWRKGCGQISSVSSTLVYRTAPWPPCCRASFAANRRSRGPVPRRRRRTSSHHVELFAAHPALYWAQVEALGVTDGAVRQRSLNGTNAGERPAPQALINRKEARRAPSLAHVPPHAALDHPAGSAGAGAARPCRRPGCPGGPEPAARLAARGGQVRGICSV